MKKMLISSVVVLISFISLCCSPLLTNISKSEDSKSENSRSEIVQLNVGITDGYSPSNGIAHIVIPYLNKTLDDVRINFYEERTSIDILKSVGQEKLDLAFVDKAELYWAYRGVRKFSEPIENLRVIAMMSRYSSHWFTLKKNNIEKILDLKGKRIAMGFSENGSLLLDEIILERIGLKDNASIVQMNPNDAITDLIDGNIDAAVYSGHVPLNFFTDAIEKDALQLLDIEDELQQVNFFRNFPFYELRTIPGGTYKGIERDIHTAGGTIFLVAGVNVPNSVVSKCLEAIFSEEGQIYIRSELNTTEIFLLEESLEEAVAPVHPGAAKFYEELGICVPCVI